MRHSTRTALIIWAAISFLVAASLLVIYLRLGTAGFKLFIQQPPLINLPVTLASVTLLWLSVGALLYLLQAQRINASNLPSVAGFFLVCWVYLNILSERFRYGDYTYYFDAATSLYRNQPLPGSYFYPPLWATLLQFLVPFGQDNFFIILWLLNFVSLLGFYVLLLLILERYGFSPRLSALVTTLFMLVNVPLLRTLVYVQVNLHTLNFILLSLLFYPKRSFLSALMLALAVHMKASPAALVLAFLLEKDWRWLGWFTLSVALLAGITIVTDGVSPFFDILSHVQGLALSSNTIFHDTSFDSFLRFAGPLLHISLLWTRIAIYAAKALLAAASILVMVKGARSGAFFRPDAQITDERGKQVLNAIPPLFILMTLTSPVVWEHHGIFLALAFLVLLKRLESPAEWYWFGFAYVLEFLVPTFDFFPWSFGRLAAPLIVLGLLWVCGRRKDDSTFFVRTNHWLESLGAT
jgi:Glycosyltransferase family 87